MDAPLRNVLFVCYGNICRSPYAEHRFRSAGVGRIESDSAGFVGPDRASPDQAVAVAEERGVSLHRHRSRTVDSELLDGIDLVVVMEPSQARALRRRGVEVPPFLVLGDLDPLTPERRSIRDPIHQPEEIFRRVYGRIDRCVGELAALLGRMDPTER